MIGFYLSLRLRHELDPPGTVKQVSLVHVDSPASNGTHSNTQSGKARIGNKRKRSGGAAEEADEATASRGRGEWLQIRGASKQTIGINSRRSRI